MSERFSLEPGRWYASEIIGGEFGPALRSYSPIKIARALPLRSGQQTLQLDFYHANYPEGVRDKSYRLRVLERCRDFLLARSETHDPARFLLIHHLEREWLELHFCIAIPIDENTDHWLDRNA